MKRYCGYNKNKSATKNQAIEFFDLKFDFFVI